MSFAKTPVIRMRKHKWDKWTKEICLRCGIKREKKTFKHLMAISNTPPYNHYRYEQSYVYYAGKEKTKERPTCI